MGTYLAHAWYREYVSTFYEPLSPNILLYAAGLFLLFKETEVTVKPLVFVRNFISRYSYGIFLAHVLILSKLDDFNIRWDYIHPAIGIPVTVVLCLSITSVLIFIINKIPFGKHISG